MALERGQRLGPYEILEPLGAGGMGEVYRAKDTRLNRTIAIKVLPANVADRTEATQRFEREARAIAAMNHPHICVLHDIGNHQGTDYLVMELLEGETLAQRLAKGPLPIDEAVKYATEITDALDKAHRQGVVHRDLKPGNIMLTKSGAGSTGSPQAKLLDFGLAKLKQPSDVVQGARPAGESLANLITQSANLTHQGAIVGTLQYMSPEQLEGKEADARSDIFALGAIVYEMVTGKRAFDAKSQVSLIAAILDQDPAPVSSVQPRTPRLLDHVVKRCLAKDPDGRWQNAADVLIELELIAEAGASFGAADHATRGMGRREITAWSIAGLIALAVAAVVAVSMFRPAATTAGAPVMRFEVETPPGVITLPFSLSPDGKRLVAVVNGERGSVLWVRLLDQLSGQVLQGTEGANSVFWSPDSRYVGFVAGGKLMRVDLIGAPPQTICDAPGIAYGGTWNSDGIILFGSETGLLQVAATGGPVRPATELDKTRGETSHARPSFLPDGQHFLFLARSGENSAIFVDSLEKKGRKFLLNSQTQAVFAPPNQLLYLRENTLLAHQFDLDRLELVGDPVPIAERVVGNFVTGAAMFSVGETGQLAYRVGSNITLRRELGFVDRDGKPQGAPFGAGRGNYQNPVLSPDDQRVAVNRAEQGSDIWILDRVRGGSTKFTFAPEADDHPLWSPDGKRIAFSSTRDGQVANLYEKPSGGAGQEQPLLKSDHAKTPTDWSRDGRFIIYEDRNPKTGVDLMVLPMTGDRKPVEYLRTPFNEGKARFSPDGKWVAYTSDESGLPEVYVQSFPPKGSKWLISTAGGNQPRWRPDGKELFYLSPIADDQFMAVDILSAPADTDFKIGVPKKLFITNVFTSGGEQRNSYDVTRDGRFLLNGGVGASAAPPVRSVVTLVLNWATDLKK